GTVTVVDTVPAGLTPTNATGTGWTLVSIVGQVATLTSTSVVSGGTDFNPITLTVDVADNAAASVTNNVTVSGGGEVITTNDSASDITTINQVPDLTVSKSHIGNFTEGDTGDTYTITVHNSGGGATSGTVTVVDTVPAGLTPTNATGTGWTLVSIAGQVVTLTSTSVVAAGTDFNPITLTVSVADNAAASVTNNVTVSGGGEVNTANDSASDITTINLLPDLTVSKTHTGNFAKGDSTDTYTITVDNSGGGTTSGTVTVTDALPAGLT